MGLCCFVLAGYTVTLLPWWFRCVSEPAGDLSSVVMSTVKHQSAGRSLSITLRVALLAKGDYISGWDHTASTPGMECPLSSPPLCLWVLVLIKYTHTHTHRKRDVFCIDKHYFTLSLHMHCFLVPLSLSLSFSIFFLSLIVGLCVCFSTQNFFPEQMVAWCQESDGSIPQSQLLQVRRWLRERTHIALIAHMRRLYSLPNP